MEEGKMTPNWKRLVVLILLVVLSCSLIPNGATSTTTPTDTPSQKPEFTETSTSSDTPKPIPTETPTKTPKTPTLTATITLTYAPAEGFFELTYIVDANENPNSAIDLDTLEIRDDSPSDVILRISIGSAGAFNIIDYVNGAKGLEMGKVDIALSACRESISSFTDFDTWKVYAGYNICVLTNQDRFVLLTIQSVKDVTSGDNWGSTVRIHYLM
jgi:hypothetical protein